MAAGVVVAGVERRRASAMCAFVAGRDEAGGKAGVSAPGYSFTSADGKVFLSPAAPSRNAVAERVDLDGPHPSLISCGDHQLAAIAG